MSEINSITNIKSKIEKDDVIYNFNKEDMILRDFLDVDRTFLANERNLLAYIIIWIILFAIAISLIKLFETVTTYILGMIL